MTTCTYNKTKETPCINFEHIWLKLKTSQSDIGRLDMNTSIWHILKMFYKNGSSRKGINLLFEESKNVVFFL